MPTTYRDLEFNLSKHKFLKKPSRLFKKSSSFLPVYHPNTTELRQVFDKFDSNRDGKISPDEYKAVLRAMGKETGIAVEVQRIFEAADMNHDGFIDFKEFVEVHKFEGVKTADLHRAFQAFDRNNDGKITAEEVHEMLNKLGERCSLGDCRRMVNAVDANGDGVIDYDEFLRMTTRTMIIN